MKIRSARVAALCVLGLIAGLTVPLSSAHAQGTTYDIKVARAFPRNSGIPGLSWRFYPESVTVHPGDTIRFHGFGPWFFLPMGQTVDEWVAANAADLGDPYFIFAADPDDGAAAVKFNLDLFEGPGCGDEADPCDFDGSGAALNSGDTREFFVTITADPGETIFATQPVTTTTEFRIDVVAADQPASTQAELDALAADLKQQDLDDAEALHEDYSNRRTSETTDTGEVVWDAWAGVDEGPISLHAMYPHRLRIERGDSVRWNFPLENEIHTVVLPFAKAESLLFNNFVPKCDPDGDEGTRPDRDPTNKEMKQEACKEPALTEFEFDRRERNTPRGDGVFTGNQDFEYSGMRGPELAPDGFFDQTPWQVEFTKVSPDGGWRYFCTFHGKFMDGFVVVRR